MQRCDWAATPDIMTQYHDEEWGVPLYDDTRLFEFLTLESAQAGLSWLTILKKRENYRAAFAGFEPEAVAAFTAEDVDRLMQDAGIVRYRRKIEAAINNASVFLRVQQENSSFASYLWQFVDGRPIQNEWKSMAELPASTPVSDTIAKEMKKAGFKFLGTTTIYAHMQACGMVNDHLVSCFRYDAIRAMGEQR